MAALITMTSFAVAPKAEKKTEPCCVDPQEGPEYPSLEFLGEHAKMVRDAIGEMPEVDDDITVTLKLRVCAVSVGPNRWENRVTFKVIEGDGFADMDSSEESDQESKSMAGAKAK